MTKLVPMKIRAASGLVAVLFSVCLISEASAAKAKSANREHEPATQTGTVVPVPSVNFPTILYGAAYYHEYEPYERLDQDIKLMKPG